MRSTSRRSVIRMLAVGGTGAFVSTALTACNEGTEAEREMTPPLTAVSAGDHTLPDLPYAYSALEPYIDAQTVEIHHTRHHQAYVNNLNEALNQHPEFRERSLEDLLRSLDDIPTDIRTTVRNNGGGHLNHAFFWQIMSPEGGGEPVGDLASSIDNTFGSFTAFQEEFENAATGVFGSGWAWLITDGNGGLGIMQTPNQDTPVMEGQVPILGVDVWEHAYYLHYQNRRAEYVSNFWNVVDWQACERHFQAG